MLTRRELLAAVGAAVVVKVTGCGGNASYDIVVRPDEDGFSVFEATARAHRLGVDRNSRYHARYGTPKVTHIDGDFSENWVFEIDGQRQVSPSDAAHFTRVRAGQIVTWRTI